MAFKMKNPSMAKLTKAAGNNRVAMKMESAAKMKKEAAMKMEKESMAKLMDKASAMKMKEKSPVKKDLDSIDNNRHAPARTKDTVDPADIKRREKKVTSKRVPTDKEARAEAMKNLYKPKAPSKMKKASPAKQKMNMVKGLDGKMVPDFAVDGKGAGDMKSALTKKRTVTKGEDGLKTVTRTNRKGVVRKTKTKGTVTDAFGRKNKIKDKQTQSRDGSKVRIKTKTRRKDNVSGLGVKEKTKGVLSNFKGTDDYKTVKAKSSRRVSSGRAIGKKRTSKSTQNTQASKILRSQDGFRSYKRPTTGKRAT